jgi:hypothetical protein
MSGDYRPRQYAHDSGIADLRMQCFQQLDLACSMEFDEESQTPEIFFHQLELRPPDMNLGAGSGSHAEQTAKIMIGLSSTASWTSFSSTETSTRRLLRRWSAPCYLFRSAHARAMPEEIKRVLTDQLSILLCTPAL